MCYLEMCYLEVAPTGTASTGKRVEYVPIRLCTDYQVTPFDTDLTDDAALVTCPACLAELSARVVRRLVPAQGT